VAALVPSDHPDVSAKLAANSELARVLAKNPTWLTSLQCTQKYPRQHADDCIAEACSANWAGWQDFYAGPNAKYNSVYMSYHQPPTPTSPTAYAESVSVWPGIGGGSSQSDQLVQAGTEALAGPASDGIGSYYGAGPWYELFPYQWEQVLTNFPIYTGDAITVQVLWSGPNAGGTASFIICDSTTNYCAYPEETPLAPAAFQGQTSEWIVERPTTNYSWGKSYDRLLPFSSISINHASGTTLTSSGGQNSYTLDSNQPAGPTDMSNCAHNQILATTSGLSSPGNISISYQSSGINEFCL
jgi:hypothetical protein